MGEAWVRLPTDLVFDGGLSATEFRLLAALLSYDWADSDGSRKGRVWPSVDVLAQRLGLHRNAVSRTLRSLCRKGYIVKAQERNGAGHWAHNVYHLVADRAQKSVHGEADRAQETVRPCTKNGADRAQKSVHEERRREERKIEERKVEERKVEESEIGEAPQAVLRPPDNALQVHQETNGQGEAAGGEADVNQDDARLREFVAILRPQVHPTTWDAHVASMQVGVDGDVLIIGECGPMAGWLRGLVERTAQAVGFTSVAWPAD